jgi:type I restriction enzyme S subunit
MGKYQGYDKYKDSGVEWLGEIPEHWEVKSLRHICEFLNRRRIPLSSEHRGSMSNKIYPYYGASGIIDYVEDFIFNEPTILIAEDGANLLSRSTPLAFIADGEYWVNNHAHILKPFLGEFGYWANLLCIIKYDNWITGSAQPKLTKDNLASIKLPTPPLDEQEKIARFLDYKTKQIDKLIAKKETLIEKLDEKRTSLISHAVTKGLDVNVPMKDSGIEWLGEIPKHWEVKNLRYICEFLNKRRIPLSSEERGSMSDKIYPYYGASGIIDYVENFIFDEPTILIAEDGANLLSRSTPLAFIAEGKYWVNNHAHILKPFSGNFKYWANLLCIIEYDYWITGSAQPKLTKDNLGSIKLADPPVQEQQKIAEYLDKKTAQIEEQKTKIQQAIDVLKEYRTALITNAVTGKIDVSQVDIS